jgi:hypothetical protein
MDALEWTVAALGVMIFIPLHMIALAVNNLFHTVQEGQERLEKIGKELKNSLERVTDRLDPLPPRPSLSDPSYDPKAARDKAHEL